MELTVTLADRLYTAVDYMHLHVKERLELIKGRLRKMPPAPSARHQRRWVISLFSFGPNSNTGRICTYIYLLLMCTWTGTP